MKDAEALELMLAKDREILQLRKAIKAMKKNWKADLKDAEKDIQDANETAERYSSSYAAANAQLQRKTTEFDHEKARLLDRAVTAERKAGITVLPDRNGNPDLETVLDRELPKKRTDVVTRQGMAHVVQGF